MQKPQARKFIPGLEPLQWGKGEKRFLPATSSLLGVGVPWELGVGGGFPRSGVGSGPQDSKWT